MIKNGNHFEFEIFQDFKNEIMHAVTTRTIDITNTALLQKILTASSGSPSAPIFLSDQLHGADVHIINENSTAADLRGDVLITRDSDTPLGIRIADCAGILLYDPIQKVIANIHAGWRGLAKRVIREAIHTLTRRFHVNPENIFAGISPSIGPCCFIFSDPQKELPRFMHEFITEENTLNLWAAAENQLRECGLLSNHIQNLRICTSCNPEDFFSYRDGDTNRFSTLIVLVRT